MSVKQMGKVWDIDVPHTQTLILVALADHAQDDGTGAYPSIDRLAWKTNLSKRAVQSNIRKLEQLGIIEVVGNWSGGRGNVREYVLHLEKGARKTPFRELQRMQQMHPKKEEKDAPDASIEAVKGADDDIKRVQMTTLKGASGAPPFFIEPSDNHQKEPSEEKSAAAPPNAHYVLYEECCRLNGGDPKANPDPSKQLKVFSRMLGKYGYGPVSHAMASMAGDDYWRRAGFDAFNVERNIDKYLMRGNGPTETIDDLQDPFMRALMRNAQNQETTDADQRRLYPQVRRDEIGPADAYQLGPGGGLGGEDV